MIIDNPTYFSMSEERKHLVALEVECFGQNTSVVFRLIHEKWYRRCMNMGKTCKIYRTYVSMAQELVEKNPQ